MSRIAYVNGRYFPHGSAAVHIEDRGFQFADGIYEVCAVRHGAIIDRDPHIVRLLRSLEALNIPLPVSERALPVIMQEVVRRNHVKNGLVYLQITRGKARRDHAFPADVRPSLVVTSRRVDFEAVAKKAKNGVKCVSQPDIRWARRDIKSISLLPNILAKEEAAKLGAYEAILVGDDGFITEGSSSNIWLVDKAGRLITRELGQDILSGITRGRLIEEAQRRQIPIVEEPFTLQDAYNAAELFLTSTTSFAMPIVELDGQQIGDGVPGDVATAMFRAYWQHLENGAPD